MTQRFTLLVICAIAGVQLADLLTSSTQVRSSDCPGYQLGDLNRWAEKEGRKLSPYPSTEKPAYYEMPTNAAPKPRKQAAAPQAGTFAEATAMPPVVRHRGSGREWAPAPPVVATRSDPYGTAAIDAEVDAGKYQARTDIYGNPLPVMPVAPARSGVGGRNVGL